MEKNQGFLRKAGLCLWLLCALITTSCNITQELSGNNSRRQSGAWYLQATLIPGYFGLETLTDLNPLTSPTYDIREPLFPGPDKPRQMVLYYRLYDRLQLEQVRRQLMATGLVEKIKVTPDTPASP